ncbi:hypothetical protein GW17_00039375 [Ensete ventricosum]|nr:hypothetical protein GW17_00039375 [Ensete ventricosum]RZS17248.1 hypothetical protein BHM03_00049366 [Ensete ventricosum]
MSSDNGSSISRVKAIPSGLLLPIEGSPPSCVAASNQSVVEGCGCGRPLFGLRFGLAMDSGNKLQRLRLKVESYQTHFKIIGLIKPRFSIPSGKAPYRPVHIGPAADRSLPGSTAKINRRRSISTVGDRLKKKKGKEEEKKKEEVPHCRPRLRAARAP